MKSAVFKTLMIMIMLSSLLGQAFAMSFNPALITHEFEHEAASSESAAMHILELRVTDTDHHDNRHDHDGKFDDTVHQLLHAAHHLHLYTAPDFLTLQIAAETVTPYVVSLSPLVAVAPDPLFRPPRRTFAI